VTVNELQFALRLTLPNISTVISVQFMSTYRNTISAVSFHFQVYDFRYSVSLYKKCIVVCNSDDLESKYSLHLPTFCQSWLIQVVFETLELYKSSTYLITDQGFLRKIYNCTIPPPSPSLSSPVFPSPPVPLLAGIRGYHPRKNFWN